MSSLSPSASSERQKIVTICHICSTLKQLLMWTTCTRFDVAGWTFRGVSARSGSNGGSHRTERTSETQPGVVLVPEPNQVSRPRNAVSLGVFRLCAASQRRSQRSQQWFPRGYSRQQDPKPRQLDLDRGRTLTQLISEENLTGFL